MKFSMKDKAKGTFHECSHHEKFFGFGSFTCIGLSFALTIGCQKKPGEEQNKAAEKAAEVKNTADEKATEVKNRADEKAAEVNAKVAGWDSGYPWRSPDGNGVRTRPEKQGQ